MKKKGPAMAIKYTEEQLNSVDKSMVQMFFEPGRSNWKKSVPIRF